MEIIGAIMDITQEELVLLYLHETRSFELLENDEVPPSLTREAVSIKCGMKREELELFITTNKTLIRQRSVKVKRRKNLTECIFLTSKGVHKARTVLDKVKEARFEYIDDAGKQENRKVSDIHEELRNFGIEITLFDTFVRGNRTGKVALSEFIEPSNWKKDLFRDHAFPEMVMVSNTSCMPFGAIFIAFGEPGMVIPINKSIEIGLHPFGSGDVIRWMKRREGSIEDAYYIEGKKGFQALVSGHSKVLEDYERYKGSGAFRDEADFKGYFEVLTKYDYSIIFSSGAGYGISMAGQLGTILAALSMHLKDGIGFPFNMKGKIGETCRHLDPDKIPVWDLPRAEEPMSINDMLKEGPGQSSSTSAISMSIMRRFVRLSQAFERHWNSSFSADETGKIRKFQKVFGLREFSSGGACLSSIFAAPVLTHLEEDGSVSMDSVIYPELPVNKNLGLVIDRKGGIDNPMSGFRETFQRFQPLIQIHGVEVLKYFSELKRTSGELAKLAAMVFLANHRFADIDADLERKAICDLLQMQKGIYASLGMENKGFDTLDRSIKQTGLDLVISPIGVGNSGTFFFCVPEQDSLHSLKNVVDQINIPRGKDERTEVVTHGSSHRYIFNTDPLHIVKK